MKKLSLYLAMVVALIFILFRPSIGEAKEFYVFDKLGGEKGPFVAVMGPEKVKCLVEPSGDVIDNNGRLIFAGIHSKKEKVSGKKSVPQKAKHYSPKVSVSTKKDRGFVAIRPVFKKSEKNFPVFCGNDKVFLPQQSGGKTQIAKSATHLHQKVEKVLVKKPVKSSPKKSSATTQVSREQELKQQLDVLAKSILQNRKVKNHSGIEEKKQNRLVEKKQNRNENIPERKCFRPKWTLVEKREKNYPDKNGEGQWTISQKKYIVSDRDLEGNPAIREVVVKRTSWINLPPRGEIKKGFAWIPGQTELPTYPTQEIGGKLNGIDPATGCICESDIPLGMAVNYDDRGNSAGFAGKFSEVPKDRHQLKKMEEKGS